MPATTRRRDAERAWIIERGKLQRQLESERAGGCKAKRELEMVKKLREAEREELRATRAALMELNRDAKHEEINRVQQLSRYENAIRSTRVRKEELESERDELMTLLQLARAKLEEANTTLHGIDRAMTKKLTRVLDAMSQERFVHVARTVSSVGATQILLERATVIHEEKFAKSHQALREIGK
jgi:chromosome segregation ATPase